MRFPTTLAILVSLVPAAAAQTTWYVDANGAAPGSGTQLDPYTTIQAAIDAAAQYTDTILVSPGLYAENVFDDKGVDLQGAGPEQCFIVPPGTGPGVLFSSYGAKFSGFTVTGSSGGGVRVGPSATIDMRFCVIAGNAGDGFYLNGGVWADEHSASSCTIADNGGRGMVVLAAIDMAGMIVWGNAQGDSLPIVGGGHNCCYSSYAYSDIEDHSLVPPYFMTYPGLLDSEPFFRDPANGDYNLLPGSPCIGSGFGGSDLGALPFEAGEIGGVTYCTSGTSASGCEAAMGALGTPSASASSGFLLTATSVEGQKDGLFFYGTNGRQANTWGNGTSFVCVVPPRVRGSLLTGIGPVGTCTGVFTMDLNARWCATCPKPAHNPGAGAVGQAQLWYRDPANTSNQTSSMSDAVEYVVAP